jgi:predicted N-acetyltransferase YhbS
MFLMPNVEIILSREITSEISAAIFELTTLVWPPATDAPVDVEAKLAEVQARNGAHFILRDGEKVQAHALIFPRKIITTRGPLLVGALAAVCVHPAQRKRGYGADVVRAAFDYLPELGAEVSLYQTGVPGFYEKLGARVIDNFIFDGTRTDGAKENPFWDVYAMIYPANFDWPEGEIDLNGPGY